MAEVKLKLEKPFLYRIESDYKSFLKHCYLTDSVKTALTVVQNATVIRGVLWNRVASFRELFYGPEATYHIIEEVEEKLSKAVTVIPLTPQRIIDEKKNITSWSISSLFPNHKKVGQNRAVNKELNALLLSRAETLGVIFGGTHYKTPCQFCQNLFKRVAGSCPIAHQNHRSFSVCAPIMTLSAEMFDSEEELSNSITFESDKLGEDSCQSPSPDK